MTAAQQLRLQLEDAPSNHPMIKVVENLLETRNGEMLNSVFEVDVEKDLRYFMKILNKLLSGDDVVSRNCESVWTFDGVDGHRRVR